MKPKSTWDPGKNAATRASHHQVLEELDRILHRVPASTLNELNVDLRKLNRLRPGKFEVYVFPKVTSQTSREVIQDEEYLGPPRAFEVSVLAVNPCRQFIKGRLFSKLKPAEAFPKELAENSSRFCAIMEIKDKKLASVDKALLKQDDQLEVRLFLDDSYRVHAVDHTLFESRNKNRVVRRIVEDDSMASGLSYFPMELPLSNSKMAKTEVSSHFDQRLDRIAKHQIRKRYLRNFEATKCDGAVFTAKDPLGGKSEVGWCRGMPWPAYGENSRFFSVTQPMKLR